MEIVEELEPSAPEPAPDLVEEPEDVEPVETPTREPSTPAPEPTTPPQQTIAPDADGDSIGGWIVGLVVLGAAAAGVWLFVRRKSQSE